jgi:hypothetical protein
METKAPAADRGERESPCRRTADERLVTIDAALEAHEPASHVKERHRCESEPRLSIADAGVGAGGEFDPQMARR